jgi:hypothetical protein
MRMEEEYLTDCSDEENIFIKDVWKFGNRRVLLSRWQL